MLAEQWFEDEDWKKVQELRQSSEYLPVRQDSDILLIAGKGHETYQEINRVFHHFDDRETARDIITEIEKENV